MNLRDIDLVRVAHTVIGGFCFVFMLSVCVVAGFGIHACSGSPPPDPKPAIDFGQSLAVALCKAEAPRRGFDPKLCQVGSDFLRPFIEDAADRVAAASLEPASFVGTAGVRSVPCAPLGGSGGGGQ